MSQCAGVSLTKPVLKGTKDLGRRGEVLTGGMKDLSETIETAVGVQPGSFQKYCKLFHKILDSPHLFLSYFEYDGGV